MSHSAARRYAGLASFALLLCLPELALGQGMGMGGQSPFGASGAQTGTTLANPMANPYVNPFMNPYMTMFPTDRNDTLMYFWSAQQARGGLGSSTLGNMGPGGVPGTGMAGARGTAAGRTRAAQAPSRARIERAQSGSGGHVSGRFDEYPSFNNRARLASKFPAYANMAVDAETGGMLVPGVTPAPNQEAPGHFNHFPSYNAYNGR
jgi:hypothetical protein